RGGGGGATPSPGTRSGEETRATADDARQHARVGPAAATPEAALGGEEKPSEELVTHARSNHVDIGTTLPSKARWEGGRRKVPRTIESRGRSRGAQMIEQVFASRGPITPERIFEAATQHISGGRFRELGCGDIRESFVVGVGGIVEIAPSGTAREVHQGCWRNEVADARPHGHEPVFPNAEWSSGVWPQPEDGNNT